ncbi:MAG: HAMP domain-containing protein [Treponema sp.]|nr:HAMP domain-containing protein [Treponema sp.]
MTSRLPEQSGNEIGEITHSFNSVMEKLQDVIKDIASSEDAITDASVSLETCASATDSEISKLTEAVENMKAKMGAQETRVASTSGSARKISESISRLESLIEEQNVASSKASSASEAMARNNESVKDEIELLNDETAEMKAAISQTAEVADEVIGIKNSLMSAAGDTSVAVNGISEKIDGFKF